MKFTGKIVAVIVAVIMLAVAIPVINTSAIPNLASTVVIHGNTIGVTYITSNPVSVDTPGYTTTTDTVTYNGTTYNAVEISNDTNPYGGISNDNGRVNVTFDLNDDRPFCFEFYHPSSLNFSILVLRVTIDGVTKTYTESSSWQEWGSNVRHYIGYSDKYTSAQALGDANDWLQSDNVVNIQIQDQYGQLLSVPENVTLKIIFKPTS